MLLEQSLCLAQEAAVKWTPVPGDINIFLTLTFPLFFDIACYIHQEWNSKSWQAAVGRDAEYHTPEVRLEGVLMIFLLSQHRA